MEDDDGLEVCGEGRDHEGWRVRGGFELGWELFGGIWRNG